MQLRIALQAGVLALLLVTAIPLYAQTYGFTAEADNAQMWRRQVFNQLASKKGYPPGGHDQSGTAKVKFVIDRQGRLLSRELLESSGSELLDAAALRMIERAEPFPKPPAVVETDKFTFVVPLKFQVPNLPWACSKGCENDARCRSRCLSISSKGAPAASKRGDQPDKR